MNGKRIILSVIVALVAAQAVMAQSTGSKRSASDHVATGNEHLAAERFEDALASFDAAQQNLPDSPEVAYNRGIALYRLGRHAEAETAFQDALRPDKPELEAKAKFNLGRTAHAAAMQNKEDIDKTIGDLSSAIGFYNDALQLRPNDVDAKHNKAAAERMHAYLKRVKEIQEEEQKSPSSQPSSDSENKDEQEQEGQEGEDQQEGEQKESENQDTQENPEPSESQDPSSQPTSQPEQQPSNEDEQAEDDKNEEDGKDEEPTTQPEQQPQPVPQSQPTSRNATEDKQAQIKRISIEEAKRLLQKARDAERKRRRQKLLDKLQQQGQHKVNKDW